MNSKHQKTLRLIFKNPIAANIKWKDIESLFVNLGADIIEGGGSMVSVKLNGVNAVFHRPHPRRDTDKGALIGVRRFLKTAGVYYDEI